MYLEKVSKVIDPLISDTGFTLVEVLIAVILLSIMALGISAPYLWGFQAMDVQAEHMLLDSQLRSRMEVLVGTDFDELASGSEIVTVNGQNFTVNWNVALIDLNGDGTPEPTARQVTVSIAELPDRTLSTILVDNGGRVGKIG